MAVEARIAEARGWLDAATLERLIVLLDRARLPTDAALLPPTSADALIAATDKVRLIRAGSLRWVLPLALGETIIADDVTDTEIRRRACAQRSRVIQSLDDRVRDPASTRPPVIPGGVNTCRRRSEPRLCFRRGEGAYLEDLDGRRYIDYHAAYGAILLGHSHPGRDRPRGARDRGQPSCSASASPRRRSSSRARSSSMSPQPSKWWSATRAPKPRTTPSASPAASRPAPRSSSSRAVTTAFTTTCFAM